MSCLSPNAVKELKRLVEEEYGKGMTDMEIEEMGVRLLRLFSILTAPESAPEETGIKVTPEEFKALKYIHECLCYRTTQPSVRGITRAIGLRSSRSGHRMLKALLKRGLIYRDEAGNICMRADVAACGTDTLSLN